MSTLNFRLPWPPSVNDYWGVSTAHKTKKQIWFVKPAGKAFRDEVYYKIHQKKPLEGKLELRIVAFPPDNRRRDLDNLLKATCDSLEYANVVSNDYQFCKKTIERAKTNTKNGALLVSVGPL